MHLEANEATMETREVPPAHFLIKIESYSLLRRHEIQKYETKEFTSGGYSWRLVMYPNECDTGEDSDYVSVYLAVSDALLPENWEVTAVFSIFLFNQTACNFLYSLGKTRRFLPVKSEWGFSKFISKKVLKDPSNGYLIGDNCVFGAEVFVVENARVVERLSLKEDSVPYTRDWKISNFSQLGNVWTSEQFTAGGCKWKIKMYPKGEDDEHGRFASIYLELIDSSKKVKPCYTVRIKDQINDIHSTRTCDDRWFSTKDWGWRNFIDVVSLEDPTKGFIVNDCCHLEIDISVQAVA